MSSPSPSKRAPDAGHAGPITTRPLLGVCGVLLGAMTATCTGRLLSVGLPDLRGALHLGVDEASWIGTAFNASLMFIGPFSVYLGGVLGARRVLLSCACIFTLVSLVLPFASQLFPVLLVLLVVAGLSAGTFYPLALSFVLRNLPMPYVLLGIAVYALDIVFTTNVATSLEAALMDHLSWRWIFWSGGVLATLMTVLVYYGIPWQPLPEPQQGQPRPNWRGFLYASLGFAFLFIALDQGQRLDWGHSGVIVGLLIAGGVLLLATVARRVAMPNPLVNFRFLIRRNTLLLGAVLVFFRFSFLGTVLVIPSYLGSIKGYVPSQTGPVLLWVAVPQVFCGLLAMYLLRYVDARLMLAAGFLLTAVACLMDATLSSAWSGGSFDASQAVMAVGLAFSFNALVGSIVLEVINTGALSRPVDVLTFAGYFQTLRLFGGEAGSAWMQHFLSVREQFHSNILGLTVQGGTLATSRWLGTLASGLQRHSAGASKAHEQAGVLLGAAVRQQALTLAVTDSFRVVTLSAVCCLLLIACMGRVRTQFLQVVAPAAPPPEPAEGHAA